MLQAWLQGAFDWAVAPIRAVFGLFGLSPGASQICLGMLALVALALLRIWLRGVWTLSRRGERALGTVEAIDIWDEAPYPRIRFTDRTGRDWRFVSALSADRRTREVGASVPVLYDPHNPNAAREAGRVYETVTVAAGLSGLALLLLALAFGFAPAA